MLALFLLAFGLTTLLLALAVVNHPDASQITAIRKRDVSPERSSVLLPRQDDIATSSIVNTVSLDIVSSEAPAIIDGSSTDQLTGQPAPADLHTIATETSTTLLAVPGQPLQNEPSTPSRATRPPPDANAD